MSPSLFLSMFLSRWLCFALSTFFCLKRRQNKNNNKSRHKESLRENGGCWCWRCQRVWARECAREMGGHSRVFVPYYANLQSIWKVLKENLNSGNAAHSLSICRVERTFQAVLWRSSESSHVRTRRFGKFGPIKRSTKQTKRKIKEKQNENENAVYCLVVYCILCVAGRVQPFSSV